MTTKSREYLYGNSIRVAAERASEARREADQLACKAWTVRMLGYKAGWEHHGAPPVIFLDFRQAATLSKIHRFIENLLVGLDRLQLWPLLPPDEGNFGTLLDEFC